MTSSSQARTPAGEWLRAVAYLLLLVWMNTYICRDLFHGSSIQMASMHGFWTALAAHAGGSWFHATWWPFWYNGIPFETTYAPLVPGLAAAIAGLRGVSPAVGFNSVTGLVYILGPCTLFFAAWRLTRAPGYSFAGALFYSLTSVTWLLSRDQEFAWKDFWDARRLLVMTVWDDTPHVAALVFLPLVILFLARSIETRRPGYYAGAAVCIACATLASAFGPVMVIMAATCLLFAVQRENWRSNLLLTVALGAWGWAIAAPFLSPTLILAIRTASAEDPREGWTVGSLGAASFAVFGWVVIWHFLRSRTTDWRVRFTSLFAWVVTSIPLAHNALGRHFLPQPNRYKFEMEVALALGLVVLLQHWPFGRWTGRIPVNVRRASVLVLAALAAEQVVDFRKLEKKFTFPRDITGTIEYRAATWAAKNYPAIRFFMPGSIAQWTNTFTEIQQFNGGSFTMSTNQVQQRGAAAIYLGRANLQDDSRLSLTWLKAFGVGAIGVSAKNSQEFWKPFTHPEKFQGVLPALWSEGGVTMYRVPLREFTLAHVVPETARVLRAPADPNDVREVERYVSALDDPSLPGTSFQWEGRNRIRIRTTAGPGQILTVQESYHPGWRATVAGQPRIVQKDGLGFMWLRPGCDGGCEVVLDYDGGWELRFCRWLSWLSIAGLFVVPGRALLRRFRQVAPARERRGRSLS